MFDGSLVRQQLHAHGVPRLAAALRSALPEYASIRDFVGRYRCLAPINSWKSAGALLPMRAALQHCPGGRPAATPHHADTAPRRRAARPLPLPPPRPAPPPPAPPPRAVSLPTPDSPPPMASAGLLPAGAATTRWAQAAPRCSPRCPPRGRPRLGRSGVFLRSGSLARLDSLRAVRISRSLPRRRATAEVRGLARHRAPAGPTPTLRPRCGAASVAAAAAAAPAPAAAAAPEQQQVATSAAGASSTQARWGWRRAVGACACARLSLPPDVPEMPPLRSRCRVPPAAALRPRAPTLMAPRPHAARAAARAAAQAAARAAARAPERRHKLGGALAESTT